MLACNPRASVLVHQLRLTWSLGYASPFHVNMSLQSQYVSLDLKSKHTSCLNIIHPLRLHSIQPIYCMRIPSLVQRLSYGGRQLHEDAMVHQASLSGSRITPASTLHLSGRLRGGGGDGGSTGAESRSCYLEMYLGKRHDKASFSSALLFATLCAQSDFASHQSW